MDSIPPTPATRIKMATFKQPFLFYTFARMEIKEILQQIIDKRTECIMEDREASIPLLETLVHLAIAVDKAKEAPLVNEQEEKVL